MARFAVHTYDGQMAMAADLLANPHAWGMTPRLAHREAMAIRCAAAEGRAESQRVNVYRARVFSAVKAGDVQGARDAAFWCAHFAARIL